MGKPALVFTSHEKKPGAIEVGVCVFDDLPVYFSGRGISGEISADELKKLHKPRFIAGRCLLETADQLAKIMSLPHGLREKLKDMALEESEKQK